MSDSDFAEILKLPAEDRLRLVELLWESLSSNPLALPLSDAHRAAIDEALADHRRHPEDVLTRKQLFAEVRRR